MKTYGYNKPWWMFWKVKLEKEIEQYNRGYCWASGILLHRNGIEEVESNIDCAWHFRDFSEFDNGAQNALTDYKQLTGYRGSI